MRLIIAVIRFVSSRLMVSPVSLRLADSFVQSRPNVGLVSPASLHFEVALTIEHCAHNDGDDFMCCLQ